MKRIRNLRQFWCIALCVLFSLASCQASDAHVNIHSFSNIPSDGAEPYGSLLYAGSALFGVTPRGGSQGDGTIFKINPDGTGYTQLHNFQNGPTDGRYPNGTLVQVGSELFGV